MLTSTTVTSSQLQAPKAPDDWPAGCTPPSVTGRDLQKPSRWITLVSPQTVLEGPTGQTRPDLRLCLGMCVPSRELNCFPAC